jgi:hypothetical protein
MRLAAILCPTRLPRMSEKHGTDELAARAADAVRRVVAEAEERATEIIQAAEAKAAGIRKQAEAEAVSIRERGESDARAQIEAAKRALDELGGTLAAAATSALPKGEAEPEETETEEEQPAESPGAPEAPVSPPAEEEPEPDQTATNGDDATERLAAMKMAVDGKDEAAIEADLAEKFGPGDRTELVRDVLARLPR